MQNHGEKDATRQQAGKSLSPEPCKFERRSHEGGSENREILEHHPCPMASGCSKRCTENEAWVHQGVITITCFITNRLCDILELMNMETTITDEKTRQLLDADVATTPEHEVWITAEITATVKEYKAGKLSFRSLDDVMADFGFHAR